MHFIISNVQFFLCALQLLFYVPAKEIARMCGLVLFGGQFLYGCWLGKIRLAFYVLVHVKVIASPAATIREYARPLFQAVLVYVDIRWYHLPTLIYITIPFREINGVVVMKDLHKHTERTLF